MQQEDLVSESELEEMLNLYKGLLEEKRDELMHALTRESHAKHELEKLKRQIKVRKENKGNGNMPTVNPFSFRPTNASILLLWKKCSELVLRALLDFRGLLLHSPNLDFRSICNQ